jgi:hypothetical protein
MATRTMSIPLKDQYSHAELKEIWIAAGGNPEIADLMADIAMSESSGQRRAKSSVGAKGLWQIYFGNGRGGSVDPLANAKQAIKKLETQGLQAWVSSRSKWANEAPPDQIAKATGKGGPLGAFATLGGQLGKAPDAIAGIPDAIADAATSPLDAIKGALEPLRDMGQFFFGLTELLLTPEGTRRLAKIFVGGFILLFGLMQLAKVMGGPRPGRAVSRVAKTVATKKPPVEAAAT